MRLRAWFPAALVLGLTGSSAMALWNPPVSLCESEQYDDMQVHLRARFAWGQQRVTLTDPACPTRRMYLKNESVLSDFFRQVDPEGRRFGIPPGAGSHAEIDLFGKLEKDHFVVEHVNAFDRFDILDRKWAIDSTKKVSTSHWDSDEQFPLIPGSRQEKKFGNYTIVNGTLGDEQVGKLLKLVNADYTTMCQTSESAQGLVRVQCQWQKPPPSDMRSFVFAPDGDNWKMIMKSDGVRN